jgi:hypothetical protein
VDEPLEPLETCASNFAPNLFDIIDRELDCSHQFLPLPP